jgi:pimeloyl-ACP methyl ester carboxylesterase
MRVTRFLTPAAAFLTAIACADQSPVSPSVRAPIRASSVATASSSLWAKIVTGQTGPGSLYALYIPADWNGDAIYFAHGIVPPQAPIALPGDGTDLWDSFAAVRDGLGALGYAIAYSSFSENGLAVKDGAQRTHQLRGLLTSELKGPPKRSYLVGMSLGSLISVSLVEQFPRQYDGLFAMCGEIAGSVRQFEYIGDVRVLFDFFYPGVLPGDVITPPSTLPSQDQVQGLVVSALAANPPASLMGLYAIASTQQTPLAFVPGNVTSFADPALQTMVKSLVAALYYQLLGTQDVLDRTHGHSPYSNIGRTYTLGTAVLPPPYSAVLESMIAGANAAVPRYEMTPDARNYLQNYFVPTGNLSIPVLTLHNRWDYLVPFFHEEVFGQLVSDAGASNMLLQRTVWNYGHCGFGPNNAVDVPLIINSFQSLVDWVKTGVKPAN